MLPVARGKVSLPEGSSIDSWTLAAAVASAVAPDRREVRGADLITHKRVRPVWNPEGWERRQLDAEDRAVLQAFEGALPAIHGRMTDEEIAAFTDRWRSECAEALSARGHAYWEPIIPTPTQLYAEHIKNLDVRTRCLESLRTLVEEGQIRVSRNNEPSRIVDTPVCNTSCRRAEVSRVDRPRGAQRPAGRGGYLTSSIRRRRRRSPFGAELHVWGVRERTAGRLDYGPHR